MGSVKVTVYGRIKPCEKSNQDYRLKYGDNEDQITFGGSKASGKKSYRFRKIFGEDATQEQIFDVVAKPVIENLLSGYNGTIFTYGQTGSGKTYTMTGDIKYWSTAGLIPRTVQEIFRLKNDDTVISVTFCEIYNEHIYDLIRVDRMESDLAISCRQISLLEVNSGITHFRNLSVHIVTTAYEALQLFLRGDANKMVAETGSNARSSRSHVIFSIGLEFPHPTQENLCLKPVLYLVDLAGSEKLSKCKTPMTNPSETRYINLSLHYLEQVLIALRQPGRVHIPYRNSLMTALLRNSLGGNCITAMVATFSMSAADTDETLQTCRFAERIALIKNEVKLSELVTPGKEMDSLKKENERLKAQLKLMSNEQVAEQLNEKDKEKCAEMVRNFIRDNDCFELPLTSVRRMEYCFQIMRQEILKKREHDESENKKTDSSQGGRVESFRNTVKLIQEESLANLKKKSKQIYLNHNQPTATTTVKMDSKLIQENRLTGNKRMSRRKKNPLDIPKINITYKRWRSSESLSEKENEHPEKMNGLDLKINDLNLYDSGAFRDVNTKIPESQLWKNSLLIEDPTKDSLYLSGSFLKEKNAGIYDKQKENNFSLKFPGETKKDNKNFIKDNPSNICIYTDISCSATISQTTVNISKLNEEFSDENLEKSDSAQLSLKRIENTDTDIPHLNENYSDRLSIRSNLSNEFSARCIPLTGDQEVDEEILKFYESRYQLFKKN